jgi:hypothetical protein
MKIENNPLITISFDTETYVNPKGKYICYCVSYQRESKIKTVYGLDFIGKFFDDIIKIPDVNLLLINHNVSYDVCFIFNYLQVIYFNQK